MKTCTKCLTEKPLSEYYSPKSLNGKLTTNCKECIKSSVAANPANYDFTEKGVIRVIYKTQKSNSKVRGHELPGYTKAELAIFLYSNGFKALFDEWVDSGFDSKKKPSVDRKNSELPYSLGNIELITWQENRDRQAKDTINGTGSSGKRCKAVKQMTLGGSVLNIFHSQNEARRKTGVSNKAISICCQGKTKTSGGYKWAYA